MEAQTLFNIVLLAACGGISLYISSVRDKMKTMEHDHKSLGQTVSNMREYIPQKYATIDDLNRSVDQSNSRMNDIFSALNRIEDKIDRKADK